MSDSFITSAFIIESVVEMIQLQGCISEVEFVHTAEMGGISEHGFKYNEVMRNSITKEKVK